MYAANVSYFYNYEGAPNDGYYWLDDLEDGETIKYIPENPTREGYLFGGGLRTRLAPKFGISKKIRS